MARAALVREAETEASEVRAWVCETCTTMTEGDGPHCRSCADYWQDCANGLFDEQETDQ